MKPASLLVLFISVMVYQPLQSQQDWVLKKDKEGIKVFTRKSTALKFDELKIECEFEGRISQLAAVLLDVSNHKRWAYKTIKSYLLKANSATDLIFYTEIECPWPVENRDVVAHMILTQNLESKVMTIESGNVDGIVAQNGNKVRVKYSKVNWTVTPLLNNHYKVDYRIQIDPGGSVPAWLLNLSISKGPFETFMKLKEEIKLPQYAQAHFSFLLDY